MTRRFLLLLSTFSLFTVSVPGKTINVPTDQATIQGAINAASNGDLVLVAPGTYFENINFLGKIISVTSIAGYAKTTIDGGKIAPVATFSSGETMNSILSRFTLQNGTSSEGAGIFVSSSSPTLKNNRIKNNFASDRGGGIALVNSSAVIKNNLIWGNNSSEGAGISIRGASSAQVLGNVIHNNQAFFNGGGGIALDGAGSPLIENNRIFLNNAQQGAGIYIIGEADAVIVQNIIYDNGGEGIYLSVSSSSTGLLFINNTIFDNSGNGVALVGSGVWAGGFDSNDRFYNNLVIGTRQQGEVVFHCDTSTSSIPPTVNSNDVFSSVGTAFDGSCTDELGTHGNISADPKFAFAFNRSDESIFSLLAGSPAIDSGNNSIPNLPSKDLGANPRIINGNGTPVAVVDMGAYEFVPVQFVPRNLAFGPSLVGSSTTQYAQIFNHLDSSVSVSSISAPTGYSVSSIFCNSNSELPPFDIAAGSFCYFAVTFQPQKSGHFIGNIVFNDNAGSTPQSLPLSGRAQ